MPSITPPISHHGISAKQIILLREELDIDDEMNEEETKEVDDDPYFLLAQRLANAPQVKVRFLRLQPTAMELSQYSTNELYIKFEVYTSDSGSHVCPVDSITSTVRPW